MGGEGLEKHIYNWAFGLRLIYFALNNRVRNLHLKIVVFLHVHVYMYLWIKHVHVLHLRVFEGATFLCRQIVTHIIQQRQFGFKSLWCTIIIIFLCESE